MASLRSLIPTRYDYRQDPDIAELVTEARHKRMRFKERDYTKKSVKTPRIKLSLAEAAELLSMLEE